MASVRVANAVGAGFPVGTKVPAYALKGAQTVTPLSGPGPGAVIEEPTVAADGSLEYTGLTEGNYYLLAAEVAGTWRYLHIRADVTAEQTVIAAQATGDFSVMTAGKGFRVKEGANAKMGTGKLTAGKQTVANTSVTATSRIFLSGIGGTAAGALFVAAVVAGTSFTVESTSGTDAREYNWLIFEPA